MTWQAVDLRFIDEANAVAPNHAGIYPGGRHLIHGEPETAKTIATCAIALDEIRSGGRVVAVDLEMGARRKAHLLRDLGATDDDLDRWAHIEPDAPPTEEDIESILRYERPTLLLVDAAAGAFAVSALDDEARKDVEQFMRAWIEPFNAEGITTIIVDHVVKNREQRGRWAIGSERKLGYVDVAFEYTVAKQLRRGGRGLITIVTRKDRFGYLPRGTARELHLTSDPDTHALAWQFREPAAPTVKEPDEVPLVDRIVAYVTEHPGESKNTIAKNVGGERKATLRAIDDAIADALVHVQPGPRNAHLLYPRDWFSPLANQSEQVDRSLVLGTGSPTPSIGGENQSGLSGSPTGSHGEAA